MVATLIILCFTQLFTLALIFGLVLSHRRLIEFITRRFYDIELQLKDRTLL